MVPSKAPKNYRLLAAAIFIAGLIVWFYSNGFALALLCPSVVENKRMTATAWFLRGFALAVATSGNIYWTLTLDASKQLWSKNSYLTSPELKKKFEHLVFAIAAVGAFVLLAVIFAAKYPR